MTLVHEKGAASADSAFRKEDDTNIAGSVDSTIPGEQRIPWSERFSIRLSGWQLIPFILGHAAIVISVLGTVWGGPNG